MKPSPEQLARTYGKEPTKTEIQQVIQALENQTGELRTVHSGETLTPIQDAIKRRELPLVMGGQNRDDASVSNDALVIGVSMTIVCVTVGIVALVLVFS